MAIADRVTAAEIGKTYAETIRDEAGPKQLWMRSYRDYVELWLVVEPIEHDAELRLYAAEDAIYDRFPEASVRLHILNPRHIRAFEPAAILPPGAEETALRAQ